MRKVGTRGVVDRQPGDRTRDLVVVVLRKQEAQRLLVAASGHVVPGAANGRHHDRGDGVAHLGLLEICAGQRVVELDEHVLVRTECGVRTQVQLGLAVGLHGADVVGPGRRHEVADVTRASSNLHRVALPVSVAENLVQPQVGHFVCAEGTEIGEALLHFRGPLRSALAALLGEDLDHAGRRLGAIEGGGRGSLDDLDAVDVVRVDVVERAIGIFGSVLTGGRLALGAHPVDVDEGLVAECDAYVAAQADVGAGTRVPGAELHARTRNARLQELADVVHRLRDLGDVDLLDRVADLAPAGLARGPGDDDLVEVDGLFVQAEVRAGRLIVGDGHLL